MIVDVIIGLAVILGLLWLKDVATNADQKRKSQGDDYFDDETY